MRSKPRCVFSVLTITYNQQFKLHIQDLYMKRLLFLLTSFLVQQLSAQEPGHVYAPNIGIIKFSAYGNQLAPAIWKLNSGDQLELNFDDMDGNVKNYSYTYQLCNADWTPAVLSQFDYISGFTQMRISNYRMSSIALTRYTHYQVILPERNCVPSRSGNYILKVFRDGDPTKLVFTRRLLVVDQKSDVSLQILQPFSGQFFRSSQKLQFSVNTSKLNLFNAMQQVNVCLIQNYRWDNYISGIRPTFIRQGTLEYNTETDALFPGGREWRWLDLRSFRLQSDRVERADYGKTATTIYVKPDLDRSQQRFIFYRDNDGLFFNETTEGYNPLWQADYATVNFRFVPPGNQPMAGKDVYITGELTNYGDLDSAKMRFNTETGMYETSLKLKQGYYDYGYATRDQKNAQRPSFDVTEGNFWETENTYMILVYYRALGGRADELIGITQLNSLPARQ